MPRMNDDATSDYVSLNISLTTLMVEETSLRDWLKLTKLALYVFSTGCIIGSVQKYPSDWYRGHISINELPAKEEDPSSHY